MWSMLSDQSPLLSGVSCKPHQGRWEKRESIITPSGSRYMNNAKCRGRNIKGQWAWINIFKWPPHLFSGAGVWNNQCGTCNNKGKCQQQKIRKHKQLGKQSKVAECHNYSNSCRRKSAKIHLSISTVVCCLHFALFVWFFEFCFCDILTFWCLSCGVHKSWPPADFLMCKMLQTVSIWKSLCRQGNKIPDHLFNVHPPCTVVVAKVWSKSTVSEAS